MQEYLVEYGRQPRSTHSRFFSAAPARRGGRSNYPDDDTARQEALSYAHLIDDDLAVRVFSREVSEWVDFGFGKNDDAEA